MFVVFIATFVVFFATFGVRALALDTHTNDLWEEHKGLIKEIAHQGLCGDGTRPKLMNVQLDGGLKTYELRCGEPPRTNTSIETRGLDKRQVTPMCSTACNSHCLFPADYNPEAADCVRIAEILRSRNTDWNVPVGGTNVVSYNTCIFTFVNQGHGTMSYCDSDWAVIGNNLAMVCPSSGATPAKGGVCTNSNFYIQVMRTENMPMSASSGGASTQSSSSLPSSSSTQQASRSTTDTRTTSSTEVSRSTTVSYQTPGGFSDGIGEGPIPSGSISSSTENSQSHPPRKIDIAAIVGGTIGGIAGVAFLLAIFLVIRRVRSYEELQSLTADSYPPSHFRTTFTDPDAFKIPTSSASMVEIGSTVQDSALPCEFGSTSSPQKATSSWQGQRAIPQPQNSVAGSSLGHTSITERRPLETALPGVEVPAPTVEALIAAAALPDMSQEQIDIFAANFVSLVRGRQVLGEEIEDEENQSEIRQPPPYQ